MSSTGQDASRTQSTNLKEEGKHLDSELKGLGWNPEYIKEVLEMPNFKPHVGKSLGDLPHDLQTSLLGILSSMSQISNETEQMILAQPVRAIFAYGTLRADFTPKGDKWGVAQDGCRWQKGKVADFAIYQNPNLYYPFAVRAKDSSIVGTLLEWDNESTFARKLRQCNSIEGYDPIAKTGLYQRVVVTVSTPKGSTPAFMYHQEAEPATLQACVKVPSGDWLLSKV